MKNLKNKIRICVCGGRDYADIETVKKTLDGFLRISNQFIIIHGGAKGVDSLAGEWAEENNIEIEVYKADWSKHGKSAGPIRNVLMLSTGIDILVAFPGNKGTAHMIEICEKSGIKVKK